MVGQRSQIVMTHPELVNFINQSRTATLATIGPNGIPLLVAI